jgi:amino acid transporter
MIVGARTTYALGSDWDSLRFIGQWESARGSPSLAIIVQSAICLALVGFGAFQADGFDAMVEFTAPVFWFFLFLIGIAVFILRMKHREVKRDFSIPLYPLTPLLFCISCAYLSYSSFAYAHSKGAVYISIYVMLLGLVALLFLNLKRNYKK